MALKGLEHERMRFESMDYRQLCTRLKRITTPQKLLDFSKMAGEYGFAGLQTAALQKYSTLTGTSYAVAAEKIRAVKLSRPKPHKAHLTPEKVQLEIETSIFGKYLLM